MANSVDLHRLTGLLRDAGQRVTPQRLLVLGALDQQGTHLNAEDVFLAVEAQSPAVNRSTVYRTLERLRDVGVLSETDLGNGVRQFELIEEDRHHHLICRKCGGMADLEDAAVAPLREIVRERYGFHVEIDHLALFGRCSRCEMETADRATV